MKKIITITIICGLANMAFSQNFGINIGNPGATLTVKTHGTDPGTYDDGKTVFATGSYGSGQSYDGGIEFRHDNLSQGVGIGYNTIYQTGFNANQDLNLIAKGSGPLTLNAVGGATGNVGIGTASPATKLDVAGTVKATKYRGDGTTRPAFSVWQTSMGNPGGGTLVTYNSTGLNQGGGMNLGNGTFTAPVAGVYHFTFCGFRENGAGTTSIVFWVNGGNQGPRSYSNDGSNNYSPHAIATTLHLAAGNTVAVYVESGALHGNANNQFSGFLVAED